MASSKIVRGDRLPDALRADVLRRYVHRWTVENSRQTYRGACPACEQATRGGRIVTGGAPDIPVKTWTRADWHAYHAPLTTDAQWLAGHAFAVTRAGKLSERHRHALPACMATDGAQS